MTRLTSEPSTLVQSMDELMAIAFAMEKESAERYAALAEHMRAVGRRDLAAIFDRLVEEEASHMDMVVAWSQQVIHQAPAVTRQGPEDVFDDEGAALVSPELQDAYRSFAMAVRNEERAFAFWSYVAANASDPEVKEAAERMAHEELEHAKTLRRERRRAFFQERHLRPTPQEPYDLAALEMEVYKNLEKQAMLSEKRDKYRELAQAARILSFDLASNPLQSPAPVGPPPPRSLEALCEWLADYYIEAGETLLTQPARERSQILADMAIKRLAFVRNDELSLG